MWLGRVKISKYIGGSLAYVDNVDSRECIGSTPAGYITGQNNSLKHFNTCSVCELSYKYFIKYENMQTEWKQMLQDSGITEDLQIGRENASGLKGKLSKISLMSN